MNDQQQAGGGVAVGEFSADTPRPERSRTLRIAPSRRRRSKHRRRRSVRSLVPSSLMSTVSASERSTPVRLRLLIWSALGVACLGSAHALLPERHALYGLPSNGLGWAVLFLGVAGIWLVPGLWLSAVVARTGAGLAAWLGTRIATTLLWYALAGPIIHRLGDNARVTTNGILIATVAATSAVGLGVALGMCPRPSRRWLRFVAALVVGAVAAQSAIWASARVWDQQLDFSHIWRLNWQIVGACALLTAFGAMNRPNLPPAPTARRLRPFLIAFGVLAAAVALFVGTSIKWSPAQRMPSAVGIVQVPAPPSSDAAFGLTPMGPDGASILQRVDFSVTDDTGRALPATTFLQRAEGEDYQTVLVVSLQPESRQLLCKTSGVGRAMVDTANANVHLPVKINVRDRTTGLHTQGVLTGDWCTR